MNLTYLQFFLYELVRFLLFRRESFRKKIRFIVLNLLSLSLKKVI